MAIESSERCAAWGQGRNGMSHPCLLLTMGLLLATLPSSRAGRLVPAGVGRWMLVAAPGGTSAAALLPPACVGSEGRGRRSMGGS